jgi:predicted nucleic acid-binding protein
MIILDTNVISEPLKPCPDPRVIDWLNSQLATSLYTTCISISELKFGVERLPEGQRKRALSDALSFALNKLVEDRILPFDFAAAEISGNLFASGERSGVSIGTADGMIAAIARSKGFIVATRDIAPFEALGLPIINPWQHH